MHPIISLAPTGRRIGQLFDRNIELAGRPPAPGLLPGYPQIRPRWSRAYRRWATSSGCAALWNWWRATTQSSWHRAPRRPY